MVLRNGCDKGSAVPRTCNTLPLPFQHSLSFMIHPTLKLFAPKPDHSSWKMFALSLITQHNFRQADQALRTAKALVPGMTEQCNTLHRRALSALHTDRLREIQA